MMPCCERFDNPGDARSALTGDGDLRIWGHFDIEIGRAYGDLISKVVSQGVGDFDSNLICLVKSKGSGAFEAAKVVCRGMRLNG